MHKRMFGVVMLLVLFMIPPALAQDERTETTVGPVTITHPDTWNMLEGPGGTIIMAEFDPREMQDEGAIPEDAIVVQMRLFGLNRIAGLMEDELTAYNIVGGLLTNDPSTGDEVPDITEIEGENFTFARVDVSNEELSSYVYVAVLNDTTFGIITTSTPDAIEALAAGEDTILAMLDTLTLDFETPLPEDAFVRYSALPHSTTAEGFPRLGNPDAPVTVTEIGSFDCPHCRDFHENYLPDLLPRIEAGEINYVYVPIYGTGNIPLGDSAARAALCAGTENFWAFHDVLFSWQDFGGFAFVYERLQSGVANAIGIPPATFDECYTSDETNAVLETARQETFAVLGQQWSTPTILVDGRPVAPLSPEELHAQINDALAIQSGE